MRIALISSYMKDLINFRGDMIQDWVARGHDVFACGPANECENNKRENGSYGDVTL